MVIVSQDKKTIINCDYFEATEIIRKEKGRYILMVHTTTGKRKIGEFKTEGRCLKVIKDIISSLEMNELLKTIDDTEIKIRIVNEFSEMNLSPIKYQVPRERQWNMKN